MIHRLTIDLRWGNDERRNHLDSLTHFLQKDEFGLRYVKQKATRSSLQVVFITEHPRPQEVQEALTLYLAQFFYQELKQFSVQLTRGSEKDLYGPVSKVSPFPLDQMRPDKWYITELSRPGGVESWVKRYRIPHLYRVQIGSEEGFMMLIPPEEANSETRYTQIPNDLGDVAFGVYLTFDDYRRGRIVGCLSVFVSQKIGDDLKQRISEVMKDLSFEKPPRRRR